MQIYLLILHWTIWGDFLTEYKVKVCKFNIHQSKYLAQLWHDAFGDSYDYIDFFMKECAPFCYTATAETSNGNIIGACYLMPINAKNAKEYKDGFYLYALCVDKKMQNLGIGSAIVNKLKYICDCENKFIVLSPADNNLIKYYEKLGFVKNMYNLEKVFDVTKIHSNICLKKLDNTKLYEMRNQCYTNLIIWNENLLNYILKENVFTNGYNFVLEYKECNYYFIAKKHKAVLKITETDLPEEYMKNVSDLLGNYFGCSKSVWTVPARYNIDNILYGMTYNLDTDDYFMNFILN